MTTTDGIVRPHYQSEGLAKRIYKRGTFRPGLRGVAMAVMCILHVEIHVAEKISLLIMDAVKVKKTMDGL